MYYNYLIIRPGEDSNLDSKSLRNQSLNAVGLVTQKVTHPYRALGWDRLASVGLSPWEDIHQLSASVAKRRTTRDHPFRE
jgi:hypothetical protein